MQSNSAHFTNNDHNNFDWLDQPVKFVAKRLLGCELISTVENKKVVVRIVETEAYDQNDEASHTYNGKTKRNSSMFLSAGHLYVYFTYGMHYCCNIVCGKEGYGAGVLIRAVEPIYGKNIIELRRNLSGISTTNGPGKTSQALGITTKYNGHNLSMPPIQLIKKPAMANNLISSSQRIGISKATSKLRRFFIINNPYLSKHK